MEKLRVFVFDDEEVVRSVLKRVCLRRGYDVHTFSRPTLCEKCRCKKGEACTDIVISDINMPGFTGIEFFTNQLRRNCKVKKMALMSGNWQNAQRKEARVLGWRVLDKPIHLNSLDAWFDACENDIDPAKRILASWFLDKTPEVRNDLLSEE